MFSPVLFVALLMALLSMVLAVLTTHLAARKQAGAGGNRDANDDGRGLDDVQTNGTQHMLLRDYQLSDVAEHPCRHGRHFRASARRQIGASVAPTFLDEIESATP